MYSSTAFSASSMLTIEISDIPAAVCHALRHARFSVTRNTTVSRHIEVVMPATHDAETAAAMCNSGA